MNTKLNQVGIVTGASQGIGLSIATYLASQGYKLLLIARNHEKLDQAARQISETCSVVKPSIAAIDVTDYLEVKKYVTEFIESSGSIDLLCNNAGYVKRGSSDLPQEEFVKMVNTNLIGAFNFIQTVTPFMKKTKKAELLISYLGLE